MSGKRSIFEEVGDRSARRSPAQTGLIDAGRFGARRTVRIWLVALFALVVAMIVVGGLTRLTDSGLSITEWRPVTGAIPPLGEAAWQAEFLRYRQTDQWRIVNQWMQLQDFKVIYWWEWGHRQLGRVTGLVWGLGFLVLLGLGRIPQGWTGRLLLPGVLGAIQGAIGWWMVASGVRPGEGMISVASDRLAVHLGLAFGILGVIIWQILKLGREERELIQARRGRDSRLLNLSTALVLVAFIQILLGALVAGIDAGRSYTDWPLMGGQWYPPDMFALDPWWRNMVANPGLVQFAHRLVAYVFLGLGVMAWLTARRSAYPVTKSAFDALLAVLWLQVALGIVAVLQTVPWQFAILHQIVAIALWALVLRVRFLSLYPVTKPIQGVPA